MTCGGGEQTRNRTCEDPLYGGRECIGPYSETQPCNEDNCPGTLYALSPWRRHTPLSVLHGTSFVSLPFVGNTILVRQYQVQFMASVT